MSDIKLIHGDCLEVMETIPDKSVDLILADPPYNAKNIGPNHRIYSSEGSGKMQLPLQEYIKFCSDWFSIAKQKAKNIVFTPGIANICYYPQPYWVVCWHKPAAVSFNRMGGFNAWEPIFIYGAPAKGKYLGQDYIQINTLNFKKGIEKNHPCPKNLELITWIIDKFSNEKGTVLDCFMGSGTTGVACHKLNRNFIGIEINPKYYQLSKKRIEDAQKQQRLFVPESRKPAEQLKL